MSRFPEMLDLKYADKTNKYEQNNEQEIKSLLSGGRQIRQTSAVAA